MLEKIHDRKIVRFCSFKPLIWNSCSPITDVKQFSNCCAKV